MKNKTSTGVTNSYVVQCFCYVGFLSQVDEFIALVVLMKDLYRQIQFCRNVVLRWLKMKTRLLRYISENKSEVFFYVFKFLYTKDFRV